MKRKVLFVALALLGAFAFAQKVPVIAVTPFAVKDECVNEREAELITDGFYMRLGNTRKVTVVDRKILDKVSDEYDFQKEGKWSDSQQKTVEYGNVLNANWIMVGDIQNFANGLLIQVRLFDVNKAAWRGGETLQAVNATDAYNKISTLVDNLIKRIESEPVSIPIIIKTDKGGDIYLNGKRQFNIADNTSYPINVDKAGEYKLRIVFTDNMKKETTIEVSTQGENVVDFSKVELSYGIGSIGPAGGIIFYDKGGYTDGWRYLEAAPANTEFTAEWGKEGKKNIVLTSISIGTGKQNTKLIIDKLKPVIGSNCAALKCTKLKINKYEDWFLPSREELNWMYKNLKLSRLGNFKTVKDERNNTHLYWSSSQITDDSDAYDKAWLIDFTDGSYSYSKNKKDKEYKRNNKENTYSVRAIRAF